MKRTWYGVDSNEKYIGPRILEGAADCQENTGEYVGHLWWWNGSYYISKHTPYHTQNNKSCATPSAGIYLFDLLRTFWSARLVCHGRWIQRIDRNAERGIFVEGQREDLHGLTRFD